MRFLDSKILLILASFSIQTSAKSIAQKHSLAQDGIQYFPQASMYKQFFINRSPMTSKTKVKPEEPRKRLKKVGYASDSKPMKNVDGYGPSGTADAKSHTGPISTRKMSGFNQKKTKKNVAYIRRKVIRKPKAKEPEKQNLNPKKISEYGRKGSRRSDSGRFAIQMKQQGGYGQGQLEKVKPKMQSGHAKGWHLTKKSGNEEKAIQQSSKNDQGTGKSKSFFFSINHKQPAGLDAKVHSNARSSAQGKATQKSNYNQRAKSNSEDHVLEDDESEDHRNYRDKAKKEKSKGKENKSEKVKIKSYFRFGGNKETGVPEKTTKEPSTSEGMPKYDPYPMIRINSKHGGPTYGQQHEMAQFRSMILEDLDDPMFTFDKLDKIFGIQEPRVNSKRKRQQKSQNQVKQNSKYHSRRPQASRKSSGHGEMNLGANDQYGPDVERFKMDESGQESETSKGYGTSKDEVRNEKFAYSVTVPADDKGSKASYQVEQDKDDAKFFLDQTHPNGGKSNVEYRLQTDH